MRKFLRFGFYCVYYPTSHLWLKLEQIASWKEVRFWIDNVPDGVFKGVSFDGYTQWIQQQGFFSGLFCAFLKGSNLKILDWGCGMAKLAPVSQAFIKDGGKYLGIDTHVESIDLCKKTYPALNNCEFYLTKDSNAFYKNKELSQAQRDAIDWPVGNATQDAFIANSVFTHLQEEESVKYMKKIYEILAPGGIAFISFHVVRNFINPNKSFNFTHPLTPGWYTSDLECPEHAIGVDFSVVEGFFRGRFKVLRWLEGNSTGGSGPSFQDIFVVQKL